MEIHCLFRWARWVEDSKFFDDKGWLLVSGNINANGACECSSPPPVDTSRDQMASLFFAKELALQFYEAVLDF